MNTRSTIGLIATLVLLLVSVPGTPARGTTTVNLYANPLTADSPVWLQQKLTPTDGTFFYDFGNAIAVAGNTTFIGAEFTSNPDSSGGAVYVFTESNGAWAEAQQLTPNDGARDFGASVACDGTTLVIGSTPNGYSGGAVYVYTKSGGTWNLSQELTVAGINEYSAFASAVAVSGTTIFIGAPGTGSNQGAVYVFTEANGTWTQTQELDGGVPDQLFGHALALSGSEALVAVPGDTFASFQGFVDVFTESNGTWADATNLSASDGAAGNHFGTSVALSGTTAFIGAPGTTVNGNVGQGAVYVFTGSGNGWSQSQELTDETNTAGGAFGDAVALDSSNAVVGAPYVPQNPSSEQGTLYTFANSSGVWSQTQTLTPLGSSECCSNSGFGTELALAQPGILAGDWDSGNGGSGATYFYGDASLDLVASAPVYVEPGAEYVSQTIVTNNSDFASPAVPVTISLPAYASFVSVDPSQGSCSQTNGSLSCDLGAVGGGAGTAIVDVKLEATGNSGTTITESSNLVDSQPPLGTEASTRIDNPPTASDGSLSTDENKAENGTLNATDPDGDSLTFSIVGNPPHGSVTIDNAGTGAYTYTPKSSYSGSDSFTFKANDGYADSNTAKISITVKASGGGGGSSGGGGGGGLGWATLLALFGLAVLGVGSKRIS